MLFIVLILVLILCAAVFDVLYSMCGDDERRLWTLPLFSYPQANYEQF